MKKNSSKLQKNYTKTQHNYKQTPQINIKTTYIYKYIY